MITIIRMMMNIKNARNYSDNDNKIMLNDDKMIIKNDNNDNKI